MVILSSRLKNLPVDTRSGRRLGKIIDLELESETQAILHYVVQRKKWLGKTEIFLIHREQVVSLSAEKMVVEDTLTKERIEDLRESKSGAVSLGIEYGAG